MNQFVADISAARRILAYDPARPLEHLEAVVRDSKAGDRAFCTVDGHLLGQTKIWLPHPFGCARDRLFRRIRERAGAKNSTTLF